MTTPEAAVVGTLSRGQGSVQHRTMAGPRANGAVHYLEVEGASLGGMMLKPRRRFEGCANGRTSSPVTADGLSVEDWCATGGTSRVSAEVMTSAAGYLAWSPHSTR